MSCWRGLGSTRKYRHGSRVLNPLPCWSFENTPAADGSGVPSAVQCLIWRIIPLCRSPIFVITREEWEETSACQHFEERRKETTKGRTASHKGFPICSLQLFLFRELVERPVFPLHKSGAKSNHRRWLEPDVWHAMTPLLLCKKLRTVLESATLAGV